MYYCRYTLIPMFDVDLMKLHRLFKDLHSLLQTPKGRVSGSLKKGFTGFYEGLRNSADAPRGITPHSREIYDGMEPLIL